MEIARKNHKSDFDAILHLVSCVGDTKKEIGWPDYDWVARFYTTSHDNVYIASNIGGVLTNCFNDNGNIHVVFNNHGLGSGTLRVEFSAEIPNVIYPDGQQHEVSPQPLNIELVRGRGDCGTIVDVEVMLSYIKGDKGDTGPQGPKGDKGDKGDAFTYEDFTPPQIADLKKPATDAAQQLLEFQTAAEANEAEREENEDSRVQAETSRAEEFATWQGDFDSKQDKLSTSEDLEISDDNELSLTNRAKLDWLISQWVAAGGTYDESTGFFGLNGITDIDSDEAMKIYRMSFHEARTEWENAYKGGGMNENMMEKSLCRVYFPLMYPSFEAVENGFRGAFRENAKVQVVNIKGGYTPGNIHIGLKDTFYRCKNLRRVIFGNGDEGISLIRCYEGCNAFYGCVNLESMDRFSFWLDTNILDLSKSPKFKIDCIETCVSNATAYAKSNTILLHPDVYAQCTDELFALAAEKNIIIATTDS